MNHGIKELPVNEVLAAAGSSKSQVYHYFQDRDALIGCTGGRSSWSCPNSDLDAVSSLEELAGVLEHFVADCGQHLSGSPVGSLASELTAGPGRAHRSVIAAFSAWKGYLASALARIQTRGDLAREPDAHELALGLLAARDRGVLSETLSAYGTANTLWTLATPSNGTLAPVSVAIAVRRSLTVATGSSVVVDNGRYLAVGDATSSRNFSRYSPR